MCDFWHIFCSGNQVPQDNPRVGDGNSGKSMDQLYNDCETQYEVEMDECASSSAYGADWRMRKACESKAMARRAACQTTARQLTNNGQHLAP
jgi:hypothetical protein